MAKKRKVYIEKEDEGATFELDLAPMLALMVTLIPIMLLSVAFVKVTVIESPLPQVVSKAIEEDRNKNKREVSFALDMLEKGGFSLKVVVNGRLNRTIRLPLINNQYDFDSLYKEAHKLKLQHPNVFRVDFNPDQKVNYEMVVKAMDQLRTIKPGDAKATITDKDTKQKAETDVMFPDVVFANVMEG